MTAPHRPASDTAVRTPAGGRLGTLRISPEQLGDLRDAHLLDLLTDTGGRVELAIGDVSEAQIELLASGHTVNARLAVDGEPVPTRIILGGLPAGDQPADRLQQ
jgi:hypothetical protein